MSNNPPHRSRRGKKSVQSSKPPQTPGGLRPPDHRYCHPYPIYFL